MDWLAKSGTVGFILAGISVITLAVFLEKAFALNLERRRAASGSGITGEILDFIRANRGLGPDRLGRLVSPRVEDAFERLSSGITFIRLVSSASPLLGLLGTVLGMIRAFRQVSEAGGAVKPALLASGIWVALLTTAEGLIVAISAFFMYHYLKHLVGRMEKGIIHLAEAEIASWDAEEDSARRAGKG